MAGVTRLRPFKTEPEGLFRVSGEYLDTLLQKLRDKLPSVDENQNENRGNNRDMPQKRRKPGMRQTGFTPVDVGDLLKEPEQPIPWVLEGYLARGSLTLLAGPPKLGKTTLAYHLLGALAKGESLLDRPIAAGKVLLLGLEEHPRDILNRLRSVGCEQLSGRVKLFSGPLPFTKSTLDEIVSYIESEHIDLVIVDTLHVWWGVYDENSAGEIMREGKVLLEAVRRTQAAWLCLVHTRKSGGEHGQEIRGSTAIPGLVDVALSLKRTEGGDPQRCLEAVSRYTETPRKLIISLRGAGYQVLGGPADVGAVANAEKIRLALREDSGQTSEELAGETGLSRRDVDRAIERLGKAVVREGTGRKGDAFHHRLDSFAATSHPGGASSPETNESAGDDAEGN